MQMLTSAQDDFPQSQSVHGEDGHSRRHAGYPGKIPKQYVIWLHSRVYSPVIHSPKALGSYTGKLSTFYNKAMTKQKFYLLCFDQRLMYTKQGC